MRLEILLADTREQGPMERIMSSPDLDALTIVLDEIHRLNLAVSSQRKTLQSIADAKNKARQKPAGARPQRPTARKPRRKP